MAKVMLNASKGELPLKKGEIDKFYIVEYTKANGTAAQRAEIKKLIKENTVERMSALTGKPYLDIKIKPVRDKFCEFFFPQFLEKKAAKTIFDLADEL